MCGPVLAGASPAACGALVRHALDAEAAARRRARQLRGAAVNAALLLALAADLSCKCSGYTSALHWLELAAAGVAGANLLRLGAALARPPARAAPAPRAPSSPRREVLTESSLDAGSSADDLSLSLSPARAWRTPPASPPLAAPPAPEPEPAPRDRFIADRDSLSQYLHEYEDRRASSSPMGGAWGAGGAAAAGAGAGYQLAAVEAAGGGGDEGGAGGAGGAAGHDAARRLHLDPRDLTQYHLNLRVWLHVTIFSRLERELAAGDAALARLGLAPLGELPAERLAALARSPGPLAPVAAPLAQLLPFLEPFADQRYVVRRLRELAAGGALSAYRGAGGGAGWEPASLARPADADLLLHVFAAYLDGQLPAAAPGLRPFSAAHVSAAPAPPPALGVHRTQPPPAPAHFVLALRGAALEVSRGRNNLPHTLLLLLAAAARDPAPPCALRRTQLGPAGLNMLWIIGR